MTETYRGGEPLATVVRSGFVEGFHRGSAVVLDADGSVRAAIGDTESPIFPRSSNKPMQSVGMLRAGFTPGDAADLALASASHRGEPFHISRVKRMLAAVGLSPADLRCPHDLPIDPGARDAIVASGGGPQPLYMNCSGKHAGMLSACVAAGWPLDDYLNPEHPLQKTVRQAVSDIASSEIVATGVDGCGAPLFALPLVALARAFLRVVSAPPGDERRDVADAMRAHPELVSGTAGADTRLMRAVPGLLSKGGAEGVAVLALPGAGAVAVKVDDGQHRASIPVSVAALRTLDLSGVDVDEGVLDSLSRTEVHGGGRAVGAVTPLWPAR